MDFNFTQPYVLGDFKEWHKGIPYYGFWALEINSEQLLSQVSNTQTQLAPWLHSNYKRQPHITLLACGLMVEKYFSAEALAKQVQDLNEQEFKSFDIECSALNSFSTCPYLAVSKPDPIIEEIRQRLKLYQTEDTPCNFTPHITLGFYNNKYSQYEIMTQLATTEESVIKTKEKVNSIIFARYNTSDLQGTYEVVERIILNS
jgi:2'-5' RNA ligase